MKKLCISLMAVLLVFSFVAFAPAQESDAVFYNPPGDTQWVPGFLPYYLFIPHFDVGGAWWSGLVVHNMSINANQYRVTFANNNGYSKGAIEGALTAYQKTAWMLNGAMCGVTTGWAVIDSQYPILSFINYGISGISVTTLGPFYSF